MKVSKKKLREVEAALAVEVRMCGDNSTPYGDIGRVYGLALALAIITDTSTDEALDQVLERNGLTETWKAVGEAVRQKEQA
jgi:hypothetical protein